MTYNEWICEENLLRLGAWARDGLTDENMAHNIGIAKSTFNKWKNEHSEFMDTLKKNKEVADIIIENALYKKATGYNVAVKKTFKVKEVIYSDTGKRLKETEKLVEGFDEIHIPADTTAQIFWLKNRKPNEWRDKREMAVENNYEDLTVLADLLKTEGKN